MHVAIINCGAGNLHSVHKAFKHVLSEHSPNATLSIVTNAAELKEASHIVLPGVGAFAHCMDGLKKLDGVIDFLNEHVRDSDTPFLGICVGMQMLLEASEEFGEHEGLGWFEGKVTALNPNIPNLPVPHMGWNRLQIIAPQHNLFKDIQQDDHAYFVHSFHGQMACKKHILASVDYGGEVVALIGRDNIVATQFHPEKSQRLGLTLIRNFAAL